MGKWVSQGLKATMSLLVAGLMLFPAAASAAPPPVGGLTQLAGAAGCFANTATPGSCQAANGIFRPDSATVSPDGKFVYVSSYPTANGGALGLAAFARDPQTGQLTQLAGTAGCYTSEVRARPAPARARRCEASESATGATSRSPPTDAGPTRSTPARMGRSIRTRRS